MVFIKYRIQNETLCEYTVQYSVSFLFAYYPYSIITHSQWNKITITEFETETETSHADDDYYYYYHLLVQKVLWLPYKGSFAQGYWMKMPARRIN